jgi:hypothetical protein
MNDINLELYGYHREGGKVVPRKCEYCGHLWRGRSSGKPKQRERCPKCQRSLKLLPITRIRISIPTSWIMERIQRTVGELDNLPWTTEAADRRGILQGRLQALKLIEKTFILPEEESLDLEETMVLNAEPESVTSISPLRKKE